MRTVAKQPCFGTFPFDFDHPERGVDTSSNWLDPRTGAATVDKLEARGLSLAQQARSDLGFGSSFARSPDGWRGAPLDAPHLPGEVRRVDVPAR